MTERKQHYVPYGEQDPERAAADGTELTAACGYRWVPVVAGQEAYQFPPCVKCVALAMTDLANITEYALLLEQDVRQLEDVLVSVLQRNRLREGS